MQGIEEILLHVWREACRHIRISESTAAIAELLLRRMAVERVWVRSIDVARSALETVAVALKQSDPRLIGARREYQADDFQRILTWCNEGSLLMPGSARSRDLLKLVLPDAIAQSDLVVAGPLCGPGGPSGVLLVEGQGARLLGPDEQPLIRALLEPFGVALENDSRLREMTALREAAEADRSSLLTRLGRRALGDTIVGEESGLRPVMDRVELVAKSDVPVLIFGETGTGKELVSRAIHVRSSRAPGPFLRVNCGAIPPELIDSQLFGHERGSFTGATDTHRGWFERADRGTLFLDEIGELPLPAQVRLLRVLQDGAFERVGAQHPITVDVRIVAATHRDLGTMVREGRFREDLWYRLAVFPIDLPPLRDRRDDIAALARHFAQRAAIRFGLAPQMPSPDDIDLLIAYDWPGNVRELASVLDRAAILGDGHRLEVAKALGVAASRTDGPDASRSAPPADPGPVPLNQAMQSHIETALGKTHGRIEGPFGAAKLLGINPHTLRARMRKLGIDWSRYRTK